MAIRSEENHMSLGRIKFLTKLNLVLKFWCIIIFPVSILCVDISLSTDFHSANHSKPAIVFVLV